MATRSARQPRLRTLPINDFSGGWNVRDSWSQIADNESPDMLNMTLDERGGVRKRLGLTRVGPQVDSSANIQALFYSAATDRLLAQVGAKLYASSDSGASWTLVKTFSTVARCHMCDFVGKVVIIHRDDTCFSYDGTAVSAAIANSPKGTCIAVWQNALWSIGDPAANMGVRLTRSDLGAITWPASPVYVDIRAKDDKPLTCVGGGMGSDVLGRGGLLLWKEDSHYRVNDPATGSYTVEDFNYGASGPQAVVTNEGVTCAICRRGIISTAGGGQGETSIVSTKVEPLFHPTQINFAVASGMVAANFQNRVLFSIPRSGTSLNSLTLEFSPNQGWIVPHSFGITAATHYLKNTFRCYAGMVGDRSSNFGIVLDVFSGATDDGAVIVARHQTRWFEPANGSACRFRRLLVNGDGSFNLFFKVNYDSGPGELQPIAIESVASTWGSGIWGTSVYGEQIFQGYQTLYSLGYGRSFSIEVQEASATSETGPNLLDVGASETLGAFAVYGYDLDIQPLGNS